MKNENKKPSTGLLSRAYVSKLIHDEEVIEFIKDIQQTLVQDHSYSELSFSVRAQIRAEVSKFLKRKSIPFHYAQFFYSLITVQEFKHPLSPTISIEVSGQQIDEDGSFLIVKRDGQIIDNPEIAIKINASVSVDEIIKFIESNRTAIDEIMITLHLPQLPQVSRWKRLAFALEVISLKDDEGLSFFEIADKLSEDENLTEEERVFAQNDSNIKTTYYRYKKHLSSE